MAKRQTKHAGPSTRVGSGEAGVAEQPAPGPGDPEGGGPEARTRFSKK